MKERELTCIGCPLGCALTVTMDGNQVLKVEGQSCKRGEAYGRKECTHPTRIVTSTVAVKGGSMARVSVKTKTDISKDKIFSCMEVIRGIEVQAPVHIGDVILKNVAGTQTDLIATKNVL